MKRIIIFMALLVPLFSYSHGEEKFIVQVIETNLVNTKTGEKIPMVEAEQITEDREEQERIIHLITIILGIFTYSLLVINIIIGFLRYKKVLSWKMRVHQVLGILTLVTASTHALLILLFD